MSCSENSLLKGVKDKQKELDTLLEQGKDGLASMQSKMDEIKVDLSGFVPVIPEVPSLQKDLLTLGTITSAAGLTEKIAELKTKFGDAVSGFDEKISSLGLNSFPPSINSADICSAMPNVETIDGVATEVPAESKIPEEEPAKPVAQEVIKKDLEELNKKVLITAIGLTKQIVVNKALALNPPVRNKLKDKVRQEYFDLTFPEYFIELAEAGGTTFDAEKRFDYPQEVLVALQEELENRYNLGWNFKSEGQKLATSYDTAKGLITGWSEAEDFATAATQAVARRKKKLV